MLDLYHIIKMLIFFTILGLCIYIAVTVKDLKQYADKAQQIVNNIPMTMKNKINSNLKMMPGDGFKVVPGGNSQDTNTDDCETCLAGASYDPSDPSVNADPAYYFDGTCHHSQIGESPLQNTSIAVRGVNDTQYNKFTCKNPGKVILPK